MSYRIEQSSQYKGRNQWNWSVWIEADDRKLEDLTEVVWVLHPSFKQTRVVRKNPHEKFKLDSSGWGTFLIRAELVPVTGDKYEIAESLRLSYPEEESPPGTRSLLAASKGNAPSVFLSYSAADKRMAEEVKNQLQSIGTLVLDVSQIEASESWLSSLDGMIRQADAVIGVVDLDEASPSVIRELQQAKQNGKRVLTVVNARNHSPGLMLDQQHLRMHFEPGKAEPIGGLVNDWLRGS